MNPHEEIEKTLDSLQQVRDELILQAHLAKLEALKEWPGLEDKLKELRAKADQVREVAEDEAMALVTAGKLLAEEIGKGYERIRKLF
jgi:hypothetical protein